MIGWPSNHQALIVLKQSPGLRRDSLGCSTSLLGLVGWAFLRVWMHGLPGRKPILAKKTLFMTPTGNFLPCMASYWLTSSTLGSHFATLLIGAWPSQRKGRGNNISLSPRGQTQFSFDDVWCGGQHSGAPLPRADDGRGGHQRSHGKAQRGGAELREQIYINICIQHTHRFSNAHIYIYI